MKDSAIWQQRVTTQKSRSALPLWRAAGLDVWTRWCWTVDGLSLSTAQVDSWEHPNGTWGPEQRHRFVYLFFFFAGGGYLNVWWLDGHDWKAWLPTRHHSRMANLRLSIGGHWMGGCPQMVVFGRFPFRPIAGLSLKKWPIDQEYFSLSMLYHPTTCVGYDIGE